MFFNLYDFKYRQCHPLLPETWFCRRSFVNMAEYSPAYFRLSCLRVGNRRMDSQLYALSGWLFATYPQSPFIMLADNVAYPYNEILHIGAEHGLLGMALFIWFVVESFRVRPSNCLSESLRISFWAFIVFSLFSYSFNVFQLTAMFAFLAASLELRPVFTSGYHHIYVKFHFLS